MTGSREGVVRRFGRYPKYRDSGVEWLGEIPVHWTVKRLKHLASINDEALPEDTDPNLEISYVDSGDVDSLRGITRTEVLSFANAPSRARRVVRNGDVIVSTVRTYLRAIATVVDPEANAIVSTGFAVVRPTHLETSFSGYAMRAPYFVERVVANSVGVGYPAINASEMACLSIAYPDVDEQRGISAFLDRETAKIDALVAKRERLIELLVEKRTALITQAVTGGIDPNVPMKGSGVESLGEVPGHWGVRRLKYVAASLGVGVVVNPSQYVAAEGVPFLYGSDVGEGSIMLDEARRLTVEHSRLLDKSMLHAGDLVMVRVGAPGVTAVIPEQLEGANCASMLIVRRHPRFSSLWLCYVLNSRCVRAQVETAQYGAAQEQFNVGHAVDFTVPWPPKQEQDAVAVFLDRETRRLHTLIHEIRVGIKLVEEFRAALISAAVTGQIDVREEVA